MSVRDRGAPLHLPTHDRGRPVTRDVEAQQGIVIEDAETGWCGAVVRVETAGGMRVVHLEDRRGRVRGFPLGPGFLLDGAPVNLTPPRAAAAAALATVRQAASRTASGSRAVAAAPARVAQRSRLFVEGTHDAELVERVWGDDLRIEGVVVEVLQGVDELPRIVAAFAPTPQQRMGVLVDHLVPGSKESRIAAQVTASYPANAVRVLGHPFVDVWQSVRPQRLGLPQWPEIPRSIEWKGGVAAHLGWPHADHADLAAAWKRILSTVRTYTDLEPTLLASVEELIDFVTVGDGP